MTDRLAPLLEFHPFTRLNALLQGVRPGGEPLALSVGEPQGAVPAVVRKIIHQQAAEWSRYPLATGTQEFREAAAGWLARRFSLPEGMIDPETNVAPAAGSREALFMVALSAVPGGAAKRNLVLMPNPFYHVYAGAVAVAGGEPHFLHAAEAGLARLVAALEPVKKARPSFETPARAKRGPAPQDEDDVIEKKREPHPEEAARSRRRLAAAPHGEGRPSRRVAS